MKIYFKPNCGPIINSNPRDGKDIQFSSKLRIKFITKVSFFKLTKKKFDIFDITPNFML